jgi:chemotaxis protein CheX
MTTAVVTAADVEMITTEVWGSAVAAGSGSVATGARPGRGDALAVGAVRISGAWDGWVTLEVPVATASRVAAAMLGLAGGEPDAADVSDAVGELANIIGGNVKSLLPAPCPVVADDIGAVVDRGSELCRADLSWDDAAVCVRVWQSPEGTTPNQGREGS